MAERFPSGDKKDEEILPKSDVEYVPDEVAYDPYKLMLYKMALRKGKEQESTLRINIIGNFKQGKTSLAKRLIGKSCEGVTSTNGIEVNRYKCQTSGDGGHTLTSFENQNEEFVHRIATVARSVGQTVRSDSGKTHLEKNSIYDYLEQTTSTEESSPQDQQPIPLETKPHDPMKAVTSKVSNIDNYVQPVTQQIQGIKKKKPMALSSDEKSMFSKAVEVQKDKPANFIDIWDFGGQHEFYATHTLFHSRRALYLLVFDLTKSMDTTLPGETEDNMKYYTRFWIESIHAFAGPDPKVILVGTHKDHLQGNDQSWKHYFEDVRKLFDDHIELQKHIHKEDFAVNNYDSEDPDISKLLACILKIHNEPQQPVKIPARWIQLEKSLRALKTPIITFEDLVNLDKENAYPLLDKEELKLFLHYHHEKGFLLFYDEDQLSDFICVSPKFLIDAFKCIITSEQFCGYEPDIETRRLRTLLREDGKLTHKLIETVWSNKPDFLNNKDAILGLLKKHYIITEIHEENKQKDWFIVPSLLKEHSSNKELNRFLDKKLQSQVRYSMKFEKSSLVHLIFHKVLAAVLGNYRVDHCGDKRLLFRNVCIFKHDDDHAALLEQRKDSGTIELRVINIPPKNDFENHPADKLRRFVESVVMHEFRKSEYNREDKKPFVPAYRCNHADHGPEGGRNLEDFKEGETVRCPDGYSHDSLYYERAKTEWCTQYDEGYPELELDDTTLSQFASKAIGENWEMLGRQLGLSKINIDHIKGDHKTTANRIFYMLYKWKVKATSGKLSDKATLDVLATAMKECGGVNIDWDKVRKIRDGCLKTQGKKTDFSHPFSNKIVTVGEALTLEHEMTETNVTVRWLKDDKTIIEGGRRKIFSEGSLHKLHVEYAAFEDAGKYTFSFDTFKTECFVNIEDVPLKFTKELEDKEVANIQRQVTFLCELSRSQTEVIWYFCNKPLYSSNKYGIKDDGPTHMLEVRDVSEKDEGPYSVSAKDLISHARLYFYETEEERNLWAQHRKKLREEERRFWEEEEERSRRLEEHGPYAYSLYRKALEAGIEEDSSIRVNVVGHFGQGKTCLVRRIIRSGIDGTESTKGIDIARYKCKQAASGNITYEQSPDLDPSDIARRIKTVSFVGKAKKKKAVLKHIKQFLVHPFRKKRIEKTEIAEGESGYKPNEMSQEEREKFVNEVIEPNEQRSLHCNNKTFDILDFGGQYVSYAIHTLFHSRKAIYLLVFNLSCGLTDIVPNDPEERTMESYIQFWINSIHSFVGNKDGSEPKIILVGTHFDNLRGDRTSKRRQADRYFDDVRALFEATPQLNHIVLEDFAVDNTNFEESTFDNLREQILRIGEENAFSNKIPAKWIQLERSLLNYKRYKIVDMTVVIDIDSTNEYPLGTTEQIKLFLKHKHDQGTLFYFDEEPVSNYIVLDPQFLVDAFKCIISPDRFIRNLPEIAESWLKLKTEGKLEMPLIDKLWGNDEDGAFMTHKETILWFLQKHRIISEAMSFDETLQISVGLGWYVVPSLLKDHCQVAEMNDFLTGKKQTQIKFVISFDSSSIVPTVYHRLTAAVLGKWSIQTFRKGKLLFANMSVVRLDVHHAGITEMNDRHIQLAVLNLYPSCNVNKVIPGAFRRFVEAVIMHEFRKYQGIVKRIDMPYERGFSCNHEIHNVASNQIVFPYNLLDNQFVPCPEFMSHEIDAAFAKAEWCDEMPTLISEETVSDKTLSRLSQVIGQNWQLLGIILGLKKVQIDNTIEETPHSTSMKIYTMLLKWRDRSPDKASLKEIVYALRKCPSITVDWDEMRNIAEELNTHEQLKPAK